MAEKVKLSKEDFEFLRKDIELEPDAVAKLVKLQEGRQKKFQEKIEVTRKEALERYNVRIKVLEDAKAKTLQQYDDEIKRYKLLMENLEKEIKTLKLKPQKSGKRKPRK